LTNRNKEPFWQTRPRLTKAQEQFLREYRRNVPVSRAPEAPTAYPSKPLAERQAREQVAVPTAYPSGPLAARQSREQQEELRRRWREYEELRSQVEEIEARPGARTPMGWIDHNVVSIEESRLISQYESYQPQELTAAQRMKPIVTPFETALSSIPRGFEAGAEAGLSITQTMFPEGIPIPGVGTIPTRAKGRGEDLSLQRSRKTIRELTSLIPFVGEGRGISETFRSLAERHGERPLKEQFAAGAVFDPLNLLPGIGFGPDIIRGLNALSKTRPAIAAALRETIQQAPKTTKSMGDAIIRTLDDLGAGAPELRKKITSVSRAAFFEKAYAAGPDFPKLPKALGTPKPRYAGYSPQFSSDVDLALFIIANPKTTSARHHAFMAWLRVQLPGFKDVDILAAGKEVKDHIGTTVQGKPKGNVTIPPSRIVREAATTRPTAAPTVAPAAEDAARVLVPDEWKNAKTELARLRKADVDDMAARAQRGERTPWLHQSLGSLREQELIASARSRATMAADDAFQKVGGHDNYEEALVAAGNASDNVLQEFQKITGIDVGFMPGPARQVLTPTTAARIGAPTDKLVKELADLEAKSAAIPEVPTAAPTRAVTDVPGGPTAREAVAGGVPPIEPITPAQRIPGGPRATPLEPRPVPPKQPLVAAGRGTYGEGTKLKSGRTIGGPGRGSGEVPPRDADAMFQDGMYPKDEPNMESIKNWIRSFLEKSYDRNFALQGLEKQSGILAHHFAQLVPGSVGAGEDTARRLYKPIIDSLIGRFGQRRSNIRFLEEYMVLMRGGDITARNPHALLPGGITNSERLLMLEEMPAKIGAKRFRAVKKAADDIWAVSGHGYSDPNLMPVDGNILELLNDGVITKEMYLAMKSNHPHYIPWQRDDFDLHDFSDFLEKSFSARPEANLSTTGIRAMGLEGSTRTLKDPLNKLLAEPYRIKAIIFRNRAAKSVVRALEEIQRNTGEELVRYIDPKREMGIVGRVTGEIIPRKVKGEISQQWETISFFEDGVKNRVQVPSVYGRVAKGLENAPDSPLVSIVRKINAPLRYGATTFNPLFLPTNIIRDGMSAMFREKVFPFIGKDYLLGVWAVMRKNALYSEAAQSGALLSGIVENMNPTRFRVKATRSTEAGRLGLMGGITIPAKATWKAIAAPFRLIEQVNIIAERGVRVAVFRKLRNEGVESLEAAIRARDATVDFAKSGHTMRTINAILPFTNAAIQGQANIARTIWNHPGRSAAFAGMFMSAVVLERVNNMRFETSSLIPDYEYTRNWIIQFAEGRRKDGTQYPIYLRIPKGEIAAMATFIPEAIAHLARDGEDRSMVELMLDQGFEVAKIISPIDIGEATGVMPPLLETAAGLQFGTRPFTKTPIVPLGEKDLPPEQQFDDRTSTLAVKLGQQFNVSPRKIDFALRDVAAGTGQQVSWLVSMALEALTGRPPELGIDDPDADVRADGLERLSQINPYVGRFVGTRGTQLDRRGYSNLDNAKTATQRVFGALPDVSRLGIRVGVVGKTIEGVELTPQQRAKYQGIMGAEVVRLLETFIYNPEFQELEDIEKEPDLRHALKLGKSMAVDIMQLWLAGQQPADTPPGTTTTTESVPTRGMTQRQRVEQSFRDFRKNQASRTPALVAP